MKTKCSSLWTESPCTLAFPQRNIALLKEERFSVFSIYQKQKVRPRNKFHFELLRSQFNLVEFRRQIHESQKYIRNSQFNAKSINEDQKAAQIEANQRLAPRTLFQQQITQRLTPNEPIKRDKIFDRNGNRSTFYESSGEEKIRYSFKKSQLFQNILQKKILGPKVYVSGSARINLSKPQNFNPGPGSYFLEKKDSQEIQKIYKRAHKSTKKTMDLSIKSHEDSVPSQDKQNFKFFDKVLIKDQKRQKKSRLTRKSTATKSKSQFIFFSII